MNLYVESSAILSWLLDESEGGQAGGILSRARRVFTSTLTLLECDRVLTRSKAIGMLDEKVVVEKRGAIEKAAEHWVILGIVTEIVARARREFPVEPIRALDAIHLATALAVGDRQEGPVMLSLDARVRDNASALGLKVLP